MARTARRGGRGGGRQHPCLAAAVHGVVGHRAAAGEVDGGVLGQDAEVAVLEDAGQVG